MMMNRRDSFMGGRNNIPLLAQHRRGQSLNLAGNKVDAADENLDLFSKNRRSLSVTSSDESSDGTFFLMLFRRIEILVLDCLLLSFSCQL